MIRAATLVVWGLIAAMAGGCQESDVAPAPESPPAGAAAPATPTTADTAAARPAARVPAAPRDITFDTLKFDIPKGGVFRREMLTPAIEALAGQTVRVRGFMFPSFQQSGLKKFVLVRDNQECCFGPGAALYDCVRVAMTPPKTADFHVLPITVEGVFGIEEFRVGDAVMAIYRLDATAVR